MKTFGKIIICIMVIFLAVVVAHLINNHKKTADTSTNTSFNNASNKNQNKIDSNTIANKENTDYIGKEEQSSQIEEEKPTQEETNQQQNSQQEVELIGEKKAIDIVKKQYATNGQIVEFDHMEGENYVIKVKEGTAQTWYLVDGASWEAEEY